MSNKLELMITLNNIKLFERNQSTLVLICGDFNLRDIVTSGLDWAGPYMNFHLQIHTAQVSYSWNAYEILLTQHVLQSTQKRGDQQTNTLDLILTNGDNIIEDLRYEAPLGKYHHCSLVFKISGAMPNI